MRVCFFGTYREEYSRNRIMLAALRSAGIEVVECHEPLWYSIEDRVQVVSGGWLKPKFWLRVARTYWRLIKKFRNIGDFDILMVGYPGSFDVHVANCLRKRSKKPLVWDVFMSNYLVASERNLQEKKGSAVNWLKKVEQKSFQLPDMLIQDTQAYVDWLHKTFGADKNKFRLIPTGANNNIFKPVERNHDKNDIFQVLYYGTYIPNHATEKIMEVIWLLRDNPKIQFELIGDGPDRMRAEDFAIKNQLRNVEFISWMDQEQLLSRIARADLCLGAFGETPQSLMTIQNKIYECMAMGKAVLTGTSPALLESLIPDKEIYICERTSEAIAHAINRIAQNPQDCEIVGINARTLFNAEYSIPKLGSKLAGYLEELL